MTADWAEPALPLTDPPQGYGDHGCMRCLSGEDIGVCPHYGIEVHAILTDLIAELRDGHRPSPDLDGEMRLCAEGCGIGPCPTMLRLDRAEERLREVQGE